MTELLPRRDPDGKKSSSGRGGNLRRVLRAIAGREASTRAELARLTGLTGPTASSLVRELIDLGLVVELGLGVSEVGKPPTILGIDWGSRCVVGVDVGYPTTTGSLTDLAGTMILRQSLSVEGATGRAMFDLIADFIVNLVAQAPAPVAGIGIGTPGLVTPEGVVLEATQPDWHGLALSEIVEERTGRPTWVANNADAAVLAEYRAAPPEDGNLALVRIASGVGLGLILGGRLHTSAGAAVGEIGHLVVDPDGTRCRCGHRGCLETLVSVPQLIERAGAVGGHPAEELPENADVLRDVLGASAVDEALQQSGVVLGSVLAHLVAIADVQHVVLSVELGGSLEPLLAAVQSELANRLLPDHGQTVKVWLSALGDDLVLAGAHAMVLAGELGIIQVDSSEGTSPASQSPSTAARTDPPSGVMTHGRPA